MLYQSTRGGSKGTKFSDIVFSSYAPDGGLFVPSTIPIVSQSDLRKWSGLKFSQLCVEILSLFVDDPIRKALPQMCEKAFSHFYNENVVPLTPVGPVTIVETFHGPTLAFKDIGLNILAQMMEYLLQIKNANRPPNTPLIRANVLTETSGDTGPAAVAAVTLNTTLVHIFCVFPRKQVTATQARQLTTMMPKHKNVTVYTDDRNSDDQCFAIKQIFQNEEFVKKYNISAMNSINWVRISAQICYFFWAYLQTRPNVDGFVDFAVPSGAFGNSTAGIFAKLMGLPIRTIIPSTNENDIIARTINNGDFSVETDYHLTLSPAMDVQIAYNIERFFWLAFHQNCEFVTSVMERFENPKQYPNGFQFDKIQLSAMQRIVGRAFVTTDDEIVSIGAYFLNNYRYVLCPHSACAVSAGYQFICERDYDRKAAVPMLCVATAHPSKFSNAVRKIAQFAGVDKQSQLGNIVEKSLFHKALPKSDDKEKYFVLPNGDNWLEMWVDQIMKDVAVVNTKGSALVSKL